MGQNGFGYRVAGNDVDLAETGPAAATPAITAVLAIRRERLPQRLRTLMVLQMPGMDGSTATRAIRAVENERLANVPIVAMIANAFREDARAAYGAGMQGHIAKPIDVNVMKRTLSEVLFRDARS